MKIPINNIVNYILFQTKKYNFDESHALNHALDVLSFSKRIFDHEVINYPYLKKQQNIIFTSALVHDICDSKYRNEKESIIELKTFLIQNKYSDLDTNTIIDIISKMSYHKIKQNGFPDLGEYQKAFHIVRESDLLAAYDFNRTILYGIYKQNLNYKTSFKKSKQLYEKRMDKHISDNLFTTIYGIERAKILNNEAKEYISNIENLINNNT